LVSIIITTYNRKPFLSEALKSVLQQTYRDREIIVIDDGSTDGTRESAAHLPDIRYQWKENGGISSARNLGISSARGEYVAFSTSTTSGRRRSLPSRCPPWRRIADGSAIRTRYGLRTDGWLNQKKRHRKYSGAIYEQCLPLCIISPSSAVIKREVFDKVGLFDETLPVCEDTTCGFESAQYTRSSLFPGS